MGRPEHVVILVKENHSFDNYFGTFPGVEGARLERSPNPPPSDPRHDHGAWLARARTAVRRQFHEEDVPAYFAYARQFTLCDHYFTDVAGPSTPNHLMLIAAASPIIDNPPRYRLPATAAPFRIPSLPASLEGAGRTWGNYGGYAFDLIEGLRGTRKLPSTQFAKDAAAGSLPTVSWVYAPHDLSEHPPDPSDRGAAPPVGDVTRGMRWTVEQVDAVVRGGLWPTTAIFITWDDWGGWFDHVEPECVERWKDDGAHPAFDGTQFRYGPRVACLVLSPHARRGHVSKTLRSHVSVVKFCETLFGLRPLNARDESADDFSDCFDLGAPPGPPPVRGGRHA